MDAVRAVAAPLLTCPFCRAAVSDLGDHYGGYQCAPCPEVAAACGPDAPRRRGPSSDYPLPGSQVVATNSHRQCSVPGCGERATRRGRCPSHIRALKAEWKRRERAAAQQGSRL